MSKGKTESAQNAQNSQAKQVSQEDFAALEARVAQLEALRLGKAEPEHTEQVAGGKIAFPAKGSTDEVSLRDPNYAQFAEIKVDTEFGELTFRNGVVQLPWEQAKKLYEDFPDLEVAQ